VQYPAKMRRMQDPQLTGSVASRKNIVLVVDDEQVILGLATTAIAEAGFRAAVAENGEEARLTKTVSAGSVIG
jgi:DNA-binding NtrC family response regulator